MNPIIALWRMLDNLTRGLYDYARTRKRKSSY
jgi:hypothetical protein